MPQSVLHLGSRNMTVEITAFVAGILVGALSALALVFPQVARAVARAIGTVALATGGGMLVWGFDALGRDSELTGIIVGSLRVTQTSEAMGWGAGLLIGGIVALLLSFLRLPQSNSPSDGLQPWVERGERLRRQLGG
jgi:hypothetical protein